MTVCVDKGGNKKNLNLTFESAYQLPFSPPVSCVQLRDTKFKIAMLPPEVVVSIVAKAEIMKLVTLKCHFFHVSVFH